MPNSIGPAIKQLRQRRGYTAKAMYTDLMSRANYARFEKGEIDTTAENLYELTKRLNVSIVEWTRIYNETLGRDEGGQQTIKVNQLLNEGWTTEDPAPLREAARIADALYQQFHYPNEHFSSLTADALATYLEQHKDRTQPNPPLAAIVAYLDAMDTWYAKDITLLFNVLQILSLEQLSAMVTRYLFMIKHNPWLGQGSTFIPSQPELIQQCFKPVVEQRSKPMFRQLLDYFNLIPMSERLIFPGLMRQVYNAFAQYDTEHDAAALTRKLDAVSAVVLEGETPFNYSELHETIAALKRWLSPELAQ